MWRSAINVPCWDEWEAFQGREKLPSELSWSWLLVQHNEHRIFFTRLQTWLLMRLNRWDIADQIHMNFLIFLGLVGTIISLVKKAAVHIPGWVLALCALTQLSDLPIENHAWGFQSQFHVSLLAMIGAVWLLSATRPSLIRIFAALTLLLLAMYSFSAGLSGSVIVVGCFLLLRWLLWRDKLGFGPMREILTMFAVVAVWALGLAYYLHDYSQVGGHPNPVLPYDLRFWAHYTNLLALGFGYTKVDYFSAALCLLLIAAPILKLILPMCRRNAHTVCDVAAYRLGAAGLAVLMSLATISLGRAGFDVGNAKSSRYSEIAMLLVPITIGILWVDRVRQWRMQRVMLITTALVSGIGLANNWDFLTQYQKIASDRLTGLNCVGQVLMKDGSGSCPMLYPAPIKDRIKVASEMKASFVDEARHLSTDKAIVDQR